jgi:hypothetical protein
MLDPKECRNNSQKCSELAGTANGPFAREVYSDLPKTWLRLAIYLENARALADD